MNKFIVTHYTIPVDHEKHPLTEPMRIAMLSDLHGFSYGKKNERLLKEISRIRPDLVAIAGDLITAEKGAVPKSALCLLEKLAGNYPVYYVNGNHEAYLRDHRDQYGNVYGQYRKFLVEHGIHLLENRHRNISAKGVAFSIYGLELPHGFYKRIHAKRLGPKEIEEIVGEPHKDSYCILLAHNPAYFPAYREWGADLICSGHLHGGGVRIPGLGGVISPQLRLFPKFDRGLFQIEASTLVVGAGLGDHTTIPRIHNPRELVVITLV